MASQEDLIASDEGVPGRPRHACRGLGELSRTVRVMTRGPESDVGNTIFLIALLVLIVGSVLLGQVFVRKRWRIGVRWAGLLLLLAQPLGILSLLLGQAL
jgi:hypothetical protein